MVKIPDCASVNRALTMLGPVSCTVSSPPRMPEALRILRDELPNIDVMISSQYSPLLADELSKGKIDAAFLRREPGVPDLVLRLLVKEPLMVFLPSDHRLAALKSIRPSDLAGSPS